MFNFIHFGTRLELSFGGEQRANIDATPIIGLKPDDEGTPKKNEGGRKLRLPFSFLQFRLQRTHRFFLERFGDLLVADVVPVRSLQIRIVVLQSTDDQGQRIVIKVNFHDWILSLHRPFQRATRHDDAIAGSGIDR